MAQVATDLPRSGNTTKDLAWSKQDKESLTATHEKYNDLVDEWNFLLAAYEGTKALVDWGVIERHERESTDNWERRKKEAYGPGYSRSIIDLFNFYQFKSPIKRQLGATGETEEWNAFEEDTDREGNNLDNFMMDASKYADVMGHVGIMVDMPPGEFRTVADMKAANVRPYCVLYFPQSVLDWEYERSDSGVRELTYLKLKGDDGYYYLWYKDRWEKWELNKDENTGTEQVKRVGGGNNRLGEIPFVQLLCDKSSTKNIGRSDLTDIARLDVSIVRNLSQGEEIINYAAFPMMVKPSKEVGPDSEGVNDDVGPTAVLEFNPEFPESKPSWLEAEVQEPIEAILGWIAHKVSEIYRASNAGGMAATEVQTQAKSGVALRAEFQLLNGKLIKKSTNNVKAQRRIIKYWHLWMRKEMPNELDVERPRTFEVENLAADLENAMTSKSLVTSKTYHKQLQKMIVRLMLPTADDEILASIDDEIENQKETAPGAIAKFLADNQPDTGEEQ